MFFPVFVCFFFSLSTTCLRLLHSKARTPIGTQMAGSTAWKLWLHQSSSSKDTFAVLRGTLCCRQKMESCMWQTLRSTLKRHCPRPFSAANPPESHWIFAALMVVTASASSSSSSLPTTLQDLHSPHPTWEKWTWQTQCFRVNYRPQTVRWEPTNVFVTKWPVLVYFKRNTIFKSKERLLREERRVPLLRLEDHGIPMDDIVSPDE